MAPQEVAGLQALAMANGGSLTVNPDTGLPEALSLKKLLPALIGFGLNYFVPGLGSAVGSALGTSAAVGTGVAVGGFEALRTGSLMEGIKAGAGAYGGAGLSEGLMAAGSTEAGLSSGALNAQLAQAQGLPEGLSSGDAFNKFLTSDANPAVSEALKNASPFERMSAGFDAAKANPSSLLNKDNFKYMAAAVGPILADQAVTAKGPQTVTKPGMIRPYSFDPYGGTYTAGTPYETTPTKAAEGGLMGMSAGGYNPGQLNFMQSSEPVVRMAEGGIAGYAVGGAPTMLSDEALYQKTGSWEAAAAARDAQNNAQNAYNWQQQADARDQAARASNITADADRLRAATNTNTVVPVDYNTLATNYVNTAAANPNITTADFISGANAANIGLTQPLATALDKSGLSAASQYALTHADIGSPLNAEETYGGLKGLSSNINYVAGGLQNLIGAGKLTGQGAREQAIAEMKKYGINEADIKRATGRTLAELFPDQIKNITQVIANQGGTTIIPGVNDYGLGGTGTSGALESVYGPSLPPGVSGAGITTVNPNGTITTRPDIPGIPAGGFTGMADVRKAYTDGGGSLGVNKNLFVPKTQDELFARYKNTGGSKAALDYLMGKTPYSPVPVTPTGEIQKPYWESVGRFPENRSTKKYVFVNGKYQLNPDYVKPSYVLAGEKAAADKAAADKKTTGDKATETTNLTNQDEKPTSDPGAGNEWLWDYASKKWYASPIQVAAAGGLMAMARGGMSQQFDLGGYSDGGRLLRGPGDGVSDSIPATIGNKRPARLADGEFVVPARIVSELGNGSTEAGARKLYAMMDRVQAARRGSIGKGKVAKNSRADKYLPA
jgi:hypothetical protein